MNWVKKKTDYSQIEEKRRILNIVFAFFFMEEKNPVISMRKNFNLLSNLGGCQDWCSGKDSNFHEGTLTST